MNAALAYILLWCPWDKEASPENCPLTAVLLRPRPLCRSHTGPDWETGWWKSNMWITVVTVNREDTKSTWFTPTTYSGAALTVRKPCPPAAWDIGQYFARADDEPLHMLRDKWNIRKKKSKETLHGVFPHQEIKGSRKKTEPAFTLHLLPATPKWFLWIGTLASQGLEVL